MSICLTRLLHEGFFVIFKQTHIYTPLIVFMHSDMKIRYQFFQPNPFLDRTAKRYYFSFSTRWQHNFVSSHSETLCSQIIEINNLKQIFCHLHPSSQNPQSYQVPGLHCELDIKRK